jgi:hypothetical protein
MKEVYLRMGTASQKFTIGKKIYMLAETIQSCTRDAADHVKKLLALLATLSRISRGENRPADRIQGEV